MSIRRFFTPYKIERAKKTIHYIRHRLQELMQLATGETIHHCPIKVHLNDATKVQSENIRFKSPLAERNILRSPILQPT